MAISDTMSSVNITGAIQATHHSVQVSRGVESNQDTGVQVGGTSIVEKQLITAIEKANQLQVGTTECQFSIHEETKAVMIKLVNSETKEVLKEIPSEKILDMFATMCEIAGLFVDEKR